MRSTISALLALLPLAIHAAPRHLPKDLHARADQAWGPNMGSTDNSKWMSKLPDTTPLHMITMPGTHDTMTFNVDMTDGFGFVKCQYANLDTQYKAGIRVVDIRNHFQDNTFRIYHSSFDTGKTFTDVMRSTGAFLDANPSEIIVMRMKQEGGGESTGNTRTFAETFNDYRDNNADTKDIFAKHYFRNYNGAWPTVGEARGKFVVLTDFDDRQPDQGFTYGDNTDMLTIEDNYAINDADSKWNNCVNQLNAAKAADTNADKRMYMSYLSASAGDENLGALKYMPIRVAMGYEGTFLGWEAYKGMNQRAFETFNSWNGQGRVGVVIMDFAGQGLIDLILRFNKFNS